MKRVVKSSQHLVKANIDKEQVNEQGFESLWQNSASRSQIVKEVEKLNGRQIVECLENSLDDETFKLVVLKIASSAMQ